MDRWDEFESLVRAVVARFWAQRLDEAPPVAEVQRLAGNLRQLVAERGLARPLRDDEIGAPGGISEEACARLVSRATEGTGEPRLAEVARQLVKACFHPEFKVCRDSFREVARDGSCRRQDLARARDRISGAHCVDCPHWVGMVPAQHEEYLAREWHGDPAVFARHRDVFLPEDFRGLRRWLHKAARRTI